MQYAHASEATCVAQGFLQILNDAILYPLIALLAAAALLVFLWGGFRFITNADNSTERAAGRGHMIYGIIGLLVMVSAMAILTIAANTFDLGIPGQDVNCAPGDVQSYCASNPSDPKCTANLFDPATSGD